METSARENNHHHHGMCPALLAKLLKPYKTFQDANHFGIWSPSEGERIPLGKTTRQLLWRLKDISHLARSGTQDGTTFEPRLELRS